MSPTVTRDGHGPCHHLHVLDVGGVSQVERQVITQSLKWGSWLELHLPVSQAWEQGLWDRAEPPLGSESLAQFLI